LLVHISFNFFINYLQNIVILVLLVGCVGVIVVVLKHGEIFEK